MVGRLQPVRSYELTLFVRLFNYLSIVLNDKFEPRPWLHHDTPREELQDRIAREGLVYTGAFGITAAEPNQRAAKYYIFVGRDGMAQQDTIEAARNGGLTLDRQIVFADLSELVAYYQVKCCVGSCCPCDHLPLLSFIHLVLRVWLFVFISPTLVLI
eukprot:m.189135 g.189135  ORF g.189135 m.189135 type:complete len:157 (-) comp16738_c0_seq12:343-813(-)